MKTTLFSFLAVTLISTAAFAQKQEDAKKCNLKHSFGFNLGTTTGVGLSYQMHVDKVLTLQLTAAPYYTSKFNQNYNTGLAGIFKLKDREYVDFISYVGVNYIYSTDMQANYFLDSNNQYVYVESVAVTTKLNIGAGIGFQFDTKRDFTFALMGGYAGYSTNSAWSLSPSIEGSLFYNL